VDQDRLGRRSGAEGSLIPEAAPGGYPE
jgi:hypothetical protein